MFRAADGRPLGEWDGIWYVDGSDFDRPRSHVYVARGRRIIGYNCPGWVSVDGYVGLQHRFEGGKRYEMVCEKKGPVIHALPDGARDNVSAFGRKRTPTTGNRGRLRPVPSRELIGAPRSRNVSLV